jgi:hypothetical protein
VTSKVDWSAWFQKEYSKDPNYSEIMDAVWIANPCLTTERCKWRQRRRRNRSYQG